MATKFVVVRLGWGQWNQRVAVEDLGTFFPDCKLASNPQPSDVKFAEGEPFCVWTYTRGEENHKAAAAAPNPRENAMKKIPIMPV